MTAKSSASVLEPYAEPPRAEVGISARLWRLRRRIGEPIIEVCIRLSGLAVVLFVFLIFLFLLKDSLSLFREYPLRKFLFGTRWLPISEPAQFGVVPLLLGSIYVTAWAILICVPLGVASAMFIAEVAPTHLKHVLKSLVEILAAIPSVVLGFRWNSLSCS